MNHRSIVALGIFFSVAMLTQAQNRQAIPRNIFEALDGENPGEGRVTISQSPKVRALVGKVSGRYGSVLGREGNTTILQGFRIQFYNSNLPNAKNEAYSRAAQIRKIAPELGFYISFKPPFWKLAIGDFKTREEANAKRQRMISLLPSWGKEAYVVPDKVRILNYVAPNSDDRN